MHRRLWTWIAVIVLPFIGLLHPPFPNAAVANSTAAGRPSAAEPPSPAQGFALDGAACRGFEQRIPPGSLELGSGQPWRR